MAVELGQGYISVSAETRRIPGQIRGALNSGAAGGTAAGAMMGTNLVGGLKRMLVTAGIAKMVTSAVSGGLERLNTLEKADIQFRNMGYSAAQTKKQLDDLNSIVTGTSTSLSDAAGAAALLGGAGVKAGDDMNNAVKALVNVSSASGASARDIGLVMMQIKASGKLMGSEALQLAQRGIPIYDLVAKSIGKTTAEVRKMGEAGEISFEQVVKAVNDGTGNLAKEMGGTLTAKFANLKTALNRASAEALKPFFEDGKQGVGGLTDLINKATPAIGRMSQVLHDKIFDEWGPKVKEAFGTLKQSGILDDTADSFRGWLTSLREVSPALLSIGGSLRDAYAALGVGAWSAFNIALQTSGTALRILAPLLETVADFMDSHPGAVTAAVAAWMLFKTVPAMVGRITTATAGLAAGTVSMTTALRNAATANAALIQTSRLGTVQMGRFGSAIGALGQSTPVIARMQRSFMNTATSATHFGRTMGTVAAAGTGLRAGLGAVTGALGGPVGLGITAALGVGMWALGNYQKKQQDAAQAAAEHKAKIDALKDSVNAYTGALDKNGKTKVVADLQESGKFDALKFNQNKGLDVTSAEFTDAAVGDPQAINKVTDALASQAQGIIANSNYWNRNKQSMEAAGITLETMSAAVAGNADAMAQMKAAGKDFQWDAVIGQTNDETLNNIRDLARTIRDTGRNLDETVRQARQADEALGGVAARLPDLAEGLKGLSKGESIEIDTQQIQGAETLLEELGYKVKDLKNGQVRVTANTDDAIAKLTAVAGNVSLLNLMKAAPAVGLNDDAFKVTKRSAIDALKGLDTAKVSPEASLVIDELLKGKAVSMNELIALSNTTADPKVKMAIDAVMAQIDTVNRGLNEAARRREATIYVRTAMEEGRFPTPLNPQAAASYGYRPPGGANGFVRQYANGGIAYGGRLSNAGIIPGRGLGKLFLTGRGQAIAGEGETGGEAFIPLGDSKRKRSTALLASVASLFGWSLVPKDSLSGMFGAMAASATKKLVGATGVDGIARFANGGVTADSLRKLADGQGASQPLTGAPYRWGQVNWGDCSGAMSAFARFAVGLDPWGGRFATASEGSQLAAMGFKMGRGGPGDLRFGWYNGGAGGGHTAGTLPDGTNVEMGGGNGGGMVGGSAAGSDDGQFTDHAYLTIGPSWTDAGEDPGGIFTRGAPGNEVPGSYTAGSGDTSISGRAGSVVGAFVTGQLADIFKTLYINDTPGVLGALAEYENSRKQTNPTDTTASKRDYEDAKLKAKQAYEAEKLKRKQDYEAERTKLKAEVDAKKISRTQYETRLAELKKKFDETELAKKQEYDKKTLEAKQKYDDLQRSQRTLGGSPTVTVPKDPGTSVPKKGQDLGPGKSSGSETPKDAVKRAFQPNNWNTGKFWDDTDWIVGKESGWNPKAQNPSSTAYGLFQFLDETWGAYGSVKTDDPFKQGEAGLKYIQKRYGDPSKARSFWEANGWYDKGGVASGAGFMAKGTIKPERILNDRQTAAFDKMVERNFETREPALVGGGDTYNYSFEIHGQNANEISRSIERRMRYNSAKSRGRPV